MLQDAPFLVLRMLLIFKYGVLSYTNMFFTCKNTLVCMLLSYRLIVIQLERCNERYEHYIYRLCFLKHFTNENFNRKIQNLSPYCKQRLSCACNERYGLQLFVV